MTLYLLNNILNEKEFFIMKKIKLVNPIKTAIHFDGLFHTIGWLLATLMLIALSVIAAYDNMIFWAVVSACAAIVSMVIFLYDYSFEYSVTTNDDDITD